MKGNVGVVRLSLLALFGAWPGWAVTSEPRPIPSQVKTPEQKAAWKTGWPHWLGPFNNGAGMDAGYELIENPALAPLVWKSEEVVPSPESVGGLRSGFSSPVVSNGRVFLFYAWPKGLRVDLPKKTPLPEGPWNDSQKADDVVLCMDAVNGKTLWKRVFEDQGIKMSGSGKGGGHYTMTIHGDLALARGSAGNLYCLRAENGDLIWTAPCEADSPNSLPAVAQRAGLVITLDKAGKACAFSLADGKPRWVSKSLGGGLRGGSTPLVSTIGGRELVLHDGSGGVSCLDATDGRELWKSPRKAFNSNTIAVFEDYLVCGGSGSGDFAEGAHGVQCYRISAEKAERLWKLDRVYNFKSFSPPVIYRGHVYISCESRNRETLKEDRYPFAVVELASGKVLADLEGGRGPKYQSLAAEGKVLLADFYGYIGAVFDATPSRARMICKVKWLDYAPDTSMAYTCGWLFVRGTNHVLCYDLRAKQ